MGKNKKKPLPQSRKKTRGAAGPAPLLAIAGLPSETAEIAAQTINNDNQTPWRAVAVAFPQRDEAIYSEQAIRDLMINVCEFAIKDAPSVERIRDPSRIALAYVEAQGSDALWDGFGHSVWPIRLTNMTWKGRDGRHWRFNIEETNCLIRQAITEAESGAVNSVRLRLEARRIHDALLLPGRNFQVTNDHVLAIYYRAFLCGNKTLDEIDAAINVQCFPFERLRKFYTRTGGQKKKFAVDHRDLVFAKAQVGQDGGQHLIERSANLTSKLLRRTLEGRFRFGSPLEPPGFQHDVQRADDAALVRERFNCADLGLVSVSGDHANVFGNDVVKAVRVEPAKE